MNAEDPPGPSEVLLVEDDPALRELFATALEESGHRVTAASCGAAAIVAARGRAFDLAVLDLHLPDMTAAKLLARLRLDGHARGAPVLLMSGEDAQAVRAAAVELGAGAVLVKPFALGELAARAAELLGPRERLRRLERRLGRAEELERMKTSLHQMLVHDQSNLLTALLGYLDLLRSEEFARKCERVGGRSGARRSLRRRVGDAERGRTLRSAATIARELHDMTVDALDIDRLEERRLPLAHEPLPIGEIVATAVEEATVVARGTKHVHLAVAPRLPIVRGDPRVLRRVLRNLLMNALQHGGDLGSVWVSVAPADGGAAALVAVEDEGAGVPPAARERIFEKFGMVDDAAGGPPRKGRGLGLAFSRLAARAHGGELLVEDRPGGAAGARFALRLPAEPRPAPAGEQRERRAAR